MIDEIMDDINSKIIEATEKYFLDDVIDIYNGVYKDYKDYMKFFSAFNSACIEHNERNTQETPTGFKILDYIPERSTLLDEKLFDYLKQKGANKWNQ